MVNYENYSNFNQMTNTSSLYQYGTHKDDNLPSTVPTVVQPNQISDDYYDNFNDSFFINGTCEEPFANETHYINWVEQTPPLLVFTVTFIIGVVGNFLIIFTIASYRRMKSTTNIFLASLASADLLLIVLCIPVKVS